jgi:hypothetical protein
MGGKKAYVRGIDNSPFPAAIALIYKTLEDKGKIRTSCSRKPHDCFRAQLLEVLGPCICYRKEVYEEIVRMKRLVAKLLPSSQRVGDRHCLGDDRILGYGIHSIWR